MENFENEQVWGGVEGKRGRQINLALDVPNVGRASVYTIAETSRQGLESSLELRSKSWGW